MSRSTATGVVLGVTAFLAWLASPSPAQLDGDIAASLVEYSLSYVRPRYDPASGMIFDFTDAGRLNVRDTAISAFTWAESGELPVALGAIEAVLDSQVLEADDPDFGNFPVVPGQTPTDNNWSAFIGSYLLVFAHRYDGLIDPGLQQRIAVAVRAAAAHRSLHLPDPSNIALLSCFTLIGAGEFVGDADLEAAGREYWTRFVDFTDSQGIAEYNSSNYLKVDLYALGFMVDYLNNAGVIDEAVDVRRLFWWGITRRYHIPTYQLAGPQYRALVDRMRHEEAGIQAFLAYESSGLIPLKFPGQSHDSSQLHAILPVLVARSWPRPWLQLALSGGQAGQFRERTRVNSDDPAGFQQITSYLRNDMAFGTVNVEPALNSTQRRPLMAHAAAAPRLGPPSSSPPPMPYPQVGVFKLSGGNRLTRVFAVQEKGSALVVVTAASRTYAETPVSLQLQWLGTSSLMPRIHGGGDPTYGDQFVVRWMNLPVAVRLAEHALPSAMEMPTLLWQADPATNLLELSVDATLPRELTYDGNPVENSIPLAFGVHIGEASASPGLRLEPISLGRSADGSTIRASWESPDGTLSLQLSDYYNNNISTQLISGRIVAPEPLDPPDR